MYDNEEFELAEIGKLEGKERGEVARKDFNYWYGSGNNFLIGVKSYLDKGIFSNAAFLLHHATESFYSGILLVFSGYRPKLHDIKKLRKRANSYHRDLLKIFLFSTDYQRECFDLLRRAYIEARYSEDYFIEQRQLEYLIKRVELLKEMMEKVCLERIEKYERG